MSPEDETRGPLEPGAHDTDEAGEPGVRVRMSDTARSRLEAGESVEVIIEADDAHALARELTGRGITAEDRVDILADAFPGPMLIVRLTGAEIEAARTVPGVRSIEENAEVTAEPPPRGLLNDG